MFQKPRNHFNIVMFSLLSPSSLLKLPDFSQAHPVPGQVLTFLFPGPFLVCAQFLSRLMRTDHGVASGTKKIEMTVNNKGCGLEKIR